MALAVEAQTHVMVNKADKGLYSVQEGLNLKLNVRREKALLSNGS
jgi:hypothetical protein